MATIQWVCIQLSRFRFFTLTDCLSFAVEYHYHKLDPFPGAGDYDWTDVRVGFVLRRLSFKFQFQYLEYSTPVYDCKLLYLEHVLLANRGLPVKIFSIYPKDSQFISDRMYGSDGSQVAANTTVISQGSLAQSQEYSLIVTNDTTIKKVGGTFNISPD